MNRKELWALAREADILNRETDAVVERAAQFRQRREQSEIICKAFQDEQPAASPAQPQQFMTDEQQEPWDEWVDDKITDYNKFLAQFLGKWRREDRQHVDEQIGSLRAEIEILRGIIKGNVATLERKRNGTDG